MRYCKNCILPETRPGIDIGDDGVCAGCHAHEKKSDQHINWSGRKTELQNIMDDVKKLGKSYDCIIPVSGGKDSTWQVIKCKEYGLKILAVTWRTPGRTKIGQENLDNMVSLGVDHIDVTINPETEKKFMLKSLEETGSTGVPMHLAIYSIPLRLAVQMDIPLIIWGESPFMEYGGDAGDTDLNFLNHDWLKRHGILQGKLADDWVDGKKLTKADMTPYQLPTEEEFASHQIQSIFLGYYLPWDPQETMRVAVENGFKVREEGPRIGLYNFADIDCDYISIHHWFKWIKFGCTRLFDNLSLEIRNGRMNRDQALNILSEMGYQRPDNDIKKFCNFVQISEDYFQELEDKYRDPNIWSRDNQGRWVINDFILKDFSFY